MNEIEVKQLEDAIVRAARMCPAEDQTEEYLTYLRAVKAEYDTMKKLLADDKAAEHLQQTVAAAEAKSFSGGSLPDMSTPAADAKQKADLELQYLACFTPKEDIFAAYSYMILADLLYAFYEQGRYEEMAKHANMERRVGRLH